MISRFSVKKPYTVLVGVLLIIVLGVVSFGRMTTDLLPDMSLQYALIITTNPGASPEKVEMEVTAPIEAAMATTTGIKNVGSMSYNSYSIVTCEYEQNVNMDSVIIEIQQNLDQLSGAWGDHVGTPMIMQINPDMLPIMTAAVDVEQMDALQLASYVGNELAPTLESLEGVASVSTSGQLEETVIITLDQEKIDEINEKVRQEISGEFVKPQKELDDALAEVEKGKQQMEEGSNQLSEALDTAIDGRDQLKETKKKLEKQLTELQKQKKQLEETLATMGPVIDEALQKRSDLLNTIQTLEKNMKDLETAVAGLEGEIQKLDGVISGLENQLAGMGTSASMTMVSPSKATATENEPAEPESATPTPESATTAPEKEPEASETTVPTPEDTTPENTPSVNVNEKEILEQQLAQAKAAKNELEKKLTASKNALKAAKDGLSQAEAGLAVMDEALVKQFSKLNGSGLVEIKTVSDISKIQPALTTAITQIDAGIEQLEQALEMIDEQSASLPDIIATLNAEGLKAALGMAPAAAELATAAAALEDAKTSLKTAKEEALNSADMKDVLTVETLSGLITAQNFDMPAGYAYKDNTQYLIRVGDTVGSIEDLEQLALMDMGMESVGIIRVSDVANVQVMDNSDETYAIVNGNPGIILSFEKQTGYSTGEVTDRLLEKFESLESQVEGLKISVLMDQGVFIDLIVDSVIENMIVGAILAILVLLVFLKDFRPTIVIACSIPLSVVTAIVVMYFTDISLNMISMSGLMLGIGMLVDNSIVVIENIYRLRNEGLSVRKACVEGSKQVAGAIVASTLTTVSVYAPIIFTEGITKQLFVDLALTVAFTLFASLVVALTVVPAMSSFILNKTKEVKTPWFDKMSTAYGSLLEKCLTKKVLVLGATLGLLVLSAVICISKGMTFMDMAMETNQLTVTVGPKEGQLYTFEELTQHSNEVIEKISDIEGIETIGATAGGNSTTNLMSGSSDSVTMYILLDENAEVTLAEVSAEIEERTKNLDCLVESSSGSSDFTAFFGSGLSIEIKGRDLDTLQELAEKVGKIVEETEGTLDVKNGLEDVTAQWEIEVDKEKAAEYGLTVAQVYQLVYGEMASNSSTTTLSTAMKDYKVYLQTEKQSDLKLEDIQNLTYEHTDKEGETQEVPLTDFCTMKETTTLSTIYRDSQTRYVTVTAGIDEHHNVTLVSDAVQKKIAELSIPEGYSIEMAGEDETIQDSMGQMVLMLLLAVIFIYLIMVAQFQSLKSPFIILFTIPLAFTGGFFALFFSGQVLSVIAMLGFIMLAGVIVNNGIVLIDYINQLRMEGKGKKEAILEAGVTRLRPILMTALTTILAMSTTAMGMGTGSEMMQPMAITMVGGLTYGTVLTLFIIPCVYDLFNKDRSMVEEEL